MNAGTISPPLPAPKNTHTHTHTPARCHPNVMHLEGGLPATQMAKREIRYPIKSDNMCAASVMIAKLPAK